MGLANDAARLRTASVRQDQRQYLVSATNVADYCFGMVQFSLCRNFSRFTMKRSCQPSPIFCFSSCASTLKTRRRPSISISSAVAPTFCPRGVAPRCPTFTSVPTVTYPSSRLSATAFQAAFSINAIIMGVPKTSTPPAPTRAAVFSWTTVVVDSPVIPGVSAIYHILSSCLKTALHYYTTKSAWLIYVYHHQEESALFLPGLCMVLYGRPKIY